MEANVGRDGVADNFWGYNAVGAAKTKETLYGANKVDTAMLALLC